MARRFANIRYRVCVEENELYIPENKKYVVGNGNRFDVDKAKFDAESRKCQWCHGLVICMVCFC